jgi:hypothetical protein
MDRKTVFTKTAKAAFTMLAKEDIITPVVQAAQMHAKEAPVPPSQSPVVTDSDDDLGFTPHCHAGQQGRSAATSVVRAPEGYLTISAVPTFRGGRPWRTVVVCDSPPL